MDSTKSEKGMMSGDYQLFKELVGSAMYFAGLDEYRAMVEEKVQRATSWSRVRIVEFDPEKGGFVDRGVETPNGGSHDGFYSYDSPLIRQVSNSTGTTTRILDPASPESYERKLQKDGYRTVCLAPILPREQFSGMVAGYASADVTPRDGKILELAAEVVALSLQIFKQSHTNDLLENRVQDYHDQMIRLESLKIMGELTAGAAGDLNNILAGILGYVQLIEKKIQDPGLKKTFEEIHRTVVTGEETVRNLQEFKKIDSEVDFEPVPLHDLVGRAVQLTHSRWLDEARARSVEYRIETDVPAGLLVSGNPTALLVAVILIIFKILDSIPDGGKVIIEADESGENVQLAFSTSGQIEARGVMAELDPFMHRREGSFFSLNLSAAEEILKRHQGTLSRESVIFKGTSIVARLPALKPATLPPPREREGCIPPRKLLVVEDEPVIRQLLNDVLSEEGFSIQTAESGPDALELLGQESFDLIITDLGMPVMSGLEFSRKVRETYPRIPIVLATGWESRLDRKKLKEYNINHVVGKPFQFDKLLELLKGACAGGQ
jgi:CheY-like chemotaxis protein